jgi:hypothetical protein
MDNADLRRYKMEMRYIAGIGDVVQFSSIRGWNSSLWVYQELMVVGKRK